MPSIFKLPKGIYFLCLLPNWGCSHSAPTQNAPLYGQIAYPFSQPTQSLGRNGPEDKFVIKSVVGNTQYIVEIPRAAKDYDIEIPLADIRKDIEDPLGLQPAGVGQPVLTDRELTSQFPNVAQGSEDASLVDNAFGVGQGDGPEQSPSYTLAVAKIGKLYQQRKFEYALIEINNMLSFYPNSPKLYKMKGTTLLKLRNYKLARDAWIKAQDLDPNDSKLRKSLARIEDSIRLQEKSTTPKAI